MKRLHKDPASPELAVIARLARVDLNLLTVFRVMDQIRHVTRAAKVLGVSQSALSHALRRLRETLGDELFVRSSSGMVRTPLAERIAPAVSEALLSIDTGVFSRQEFTPATLERMFRIETTDLVEGLLAPRLIEELATSAPRVRLAVVPVGFGLPKAALETGASDLAIAGFFGELPDGFYQQQLFEDGFLCAVRADHPRLGKARELSLDTYCEERHLLIAPTGALSGIVDKALRRKKRERLVVAGASGFTVSAWIAARTDLLVTAPARLLTDLASNLPLKTFAPPLALPPIRIVQVWHQRSHEDPAHRWFRELVRKAMMVPTGGF